MFLPSLILYALRSTKVSPHCDIRSLGNWKVDFTQTTIRRLSRYVWVFHLSCVSHSLRLRESHPQLRVYRVSLTRFGALLDTTRAPRPGEQEGREYYYTTKDAFLGLVRDNGFIEHALFNGNYYGTSTKAVKDVAGRGRICILDIEMEVCHG